MAQNTDLENHVRIERTDSMKKIEANENPTDAEKKKEVSKPTKPAKTAIVNLPMCIACVLFCLTLISIRLTSGLYAKYVATGSDNDTARVISFGNVTLTESGDFVGGSAKLIPGVNLQKRVQVGFTGSESAVYVFVEITPAGGWTTSDNTTFSMLSGKLQWSVLTGTGEWTFLSAAGGTYVYYKTLGPNTPLSNADVIANNGTITVSNQILGSELAALGTVSIALRATVVQAGGFVGASAAWASVSGR